MSRPARFALAACGALAVALVAAAIALAEGDGTAKIQTGDSIEVQAGQTVDHNLYAFGRSITIDGTIEGDLVTAGQDVVINGTVTGDILGAASNLTVHGTVRGDVRVAAEDVIVSGPVAGDLALAAGTILVVGAGTVGQDFLFVGGDVTVDGTVAGDISGSASRYARHGSVGGTESVTLPAAADQPAADATAAKAIDAIRHFALVLLFGVLGLWWAPKLTRASAAMVRSRPGAAVLGGILVLIGCVVLVISIVIATVVLAVAAAPLGFDGLIAFDLVGGLLAVFGVLFGLLFFATFLGDAIVGLALGRLAGSAQRSRSTELLWLAVGTAIVVLVTSFPVVGAWFKLFVVLLALGAVGLVLRDRRRGPQPPAVLPPPAATGDGWR